MSTTASQKKSGDSLYFSSAERAPAGAPRMLVLSYHFPPDPVVGGLRWQEMARFFIARGWAVDVIARNFSDVEFLDPARLETLSTGLRIFSVAERRPLVERVLHTAWPTVRRLLRRKPVERVSALSLDEVTQQGSGGRAVVRAYFAWLEFARGLGWARAAAQLGIRLSAQHRYAVVVSTSPPNMAHEGARLISKATGIPFVMDLRDPWSLLERLPESVASPVWYHLARRYESRCVREAALVTMNTEHIAKTMRLVYPAHASRIAVVRNGVDSETLPPSSPADHFSIRFAGSMYSDRDPRLVFRAAARAVKELRLDPTQFAIELAGDMDAAWIARLAREEGIGAHVRIRGVISRKDVLQFMSGATILLSLPLVQESDSSIPAKIYEYVRFRAWVLAICHPDSALAELLAGSGADLVDALDVDRMAACLRQRYAEYAAGTPPPLLGEGGRFDRSIQAQKMLELIEGIRARKDGTPARLQRKPAGVLSLHHS